MYLFVTTNFADREMHIAIQLSSGSHSQTTIVDQTKIVGAFSTKNRLNLIFKKGVIFDLLSSQVVNILSHGELYR